MPETTSFDTAVFFGGSFSDNGNMHALTGAVLEYAIPYDGLGYQQTYSDGAVYSSYSSDHLGLDRILNYAVAGAQGLGNTTLREVIENAGLWDRLTVSGDDARLDFNIDMQAQIDRFFVDHGDADLSDMVVTIGFGMNDFMAFTPTSPETLEDDLIAFTEDLFNAVLAAADRLLDAGAGTVRILNLPSLDFFPAWAQADPESLNGLQLLFDYYNDQIALGVAQRVAEGAAVTSVDQSAITAEVAADPTSFGFIAPADEQVVVSVEGELTVNDALSGFDPDQIAFFDADHPSTAAHAVLGMFHAESLVSDVRVLTEEANTAFMGSGDDLVLGKGGDDFILDGGGENVVLAGLGDDQVFAGAGDDILSGGSGSDTIAGGRGHDVLAGNGGGDLLLGGEGNDVLVGSLGQDLLLGGAGNDQFLFAQAEEIGGTTGEGWTMINGDTGHDTLYLAVSGNMRFTTEFLMDRGLVDAALISIGVFATGIEEIVLLDSRMEFDDLISDARLDEAGLWGLA